MSLLAEYIQNTCGPRFVECCQGNGWRLPGAFVYQCEMAGRVYPSASASCKAGAKEAAALNALRALGWQQPEDTSGGHGAGPSAAPVSYISRLTEYSQSGQSGSMPQYTCVHCLSGERGAFRTSCRVNGTEFVGYGSSKRQSRNAAAGTALAALTDASSHPEASSQLQNMAKKHAAIGSVSESCPVLVGTTPPQADEGLCNQREFRMVELVQERLKLMYSEAWNSGASLLPHKSCSVVAAFVQTLANGNSDRDDAISVVAVATGTKHLATNFKSCATGTLTPGQHLVDSHAEVLARRALVRYLAGMLAKDNAGEDNPVFQDGHVRRGVQFHLYISTAPCGDARRFTEQPSPASVGRKRKADASIHCPAFTSAGMGKLCTKINDGMGCTPTDSEGTSPERRGPMSCSDKVEKWALYGLQGGLLRSVIKSPVKLSSVIVGSRYDPVHLERALCCRAPGGCLGLRIASVPKPPSPPQGNSNKSGNGCLNWLQGAATEVTNGATGQLAVAGAAVSDQSPESRCSRLSKASLAPYLVTLAKVGAFRTGETYLQWKQRLLKDSVGEQNSTYTVQKLCGTCWAHCCRQHDFIILPHGISNPQTP